LRVAVKSGDVTGIFTGWNNTGGDGAIMDLGTANRARGLEADLSRALALAIFGEYKNRIEFVGATGKSRFTYLYNDVVDVVFRTVTWTSERDLGVGPLTAGGYSMPKTKFKFGPAYVYDGTDVIAKTGVTNNFVIVVADGSTQAKSADLIVSGLADYGYSASVVVAYGVEGGPTASEVRDQMFYDGTDGVNAIASDRSSLLGFLGSGSFVLGDDVLTSEPLAAVTREDDPAWSELVAWSTLVLMKIDNGLVPGASYYSELGGVPNWASAIASELGSFSAIFNKKGSLGSEGYPQGNNTTVENGGWFIVPRE
jgi:general L-amino acid transport system substrate-binding protein